MDEHLLARLGNKEDALVERKPEGVNGREIRQTAVAFANTVTSPEAGVLFIGVRDDGSVQGVENPEKKLKSVRDECERGCYPPIRYDGRVIEKDGKSIVAISIEESANKPHFAGPAYVRRGSESIAASPELYEELIASRNSKVAEILKMRDGSITVMCVRHKYGSKRLIAAQSFQEVVECRVVSCTPHVVHLVRSGVSYSASLSSVDIDHDVMKHRPMLIIRPVTSAR